MKQTPATSSPRQPATRWPTWIAISVEFGPGIRFVAPSRSRNSSRVSQPRRRTNSSSMSAMWAAGPPKLVAPSRRKTPATVRSGNARLRGENPGVGRSIPLSRVGGNHSKREGRDSNPLTPFGVAGFQDRCNRPLRHPSGSAGSPLSHRIGAGAHPPDILIWQGFEGLGHSSKTSSQLVDPTGPVARRAELLSFRQSAHRQLTHLLEVLLKDGTHVAATSSFACARPMQRCTRSLAWPGGPRRRSTGAALPGPRLVRDRPARRGPASVRRGSKRLAGHAADAALGHEIFLILRHAPARAGGTPSILSR